jgi:hypothetical protein
MDMVTFAILLKKIKAVASGIQNIEVNSSDPTKLDFTTTDGSTLTVQIANPLDRDEIDMVHQMEIDTDGDLTLNGKKIVTEDDIADDSDIQYPSDWD